MVYDSKDGVFPVPKGESHDQVHGYLLERSSILRDHDSIEWGFLLVGDDFILLTDGTSFDIVGNPTVHCRPLVDFFCFSDCFISSWMFGCHVIMSM